MSIIVVFSYLSLSIHYGNKDIINLNDFVSCTSPSTFESQQLAGHTIPNLVSMAWVPHTTYLLLGNERKCVMMFAK